MGINMYYMLACIYGWYCWKKNAPSESDPQIIRLLSHPERSRRISPRFPLFPLHLIWKLLAIFVCLYVLIAWILASQTDSPVPYVDALTAALSIVGMWLLTHRYAEQWLIWLVSNTISACLYCWMALYPTSILYLIYAIVAIFGFRKWKKMADREAPSNSPKGGECPPLEGAGGGEKAFIIGKQIRNIDAIILAAGDFPTHPAALQMLEHYRDRIICCDGAAKALLQAGYYPQAVVGDGDSLSPETHNAVSNRFICNPDQETNDLTKAFHYALSQNYRKILILGATGKREDHTLGNISLLADYMDHAEVSMMTNYGTFTPATGNTVFTSCPGQQISVFCMDQSPLTLRGLKWPLENRKISRWWQATLNEALSDHFEVITSGKVIVYQAF